MRHDWSWSKSNQKCLSHSYRDTGDLHSNLYGFFVIINRMQFLWSFLKFGIFGAKTTLGYRTKNFVLCTNLFTVLLDSLALGNVLVSHFSSTQDKLISSTHFLP